MGYQLQDSLLKGWEQNFPPAHVTLCSLATGEQVQETSLVAAKIQTTEQKAKHPQSRGEIVLPHTEVQRYLAAGKAAAEYSAASDVVVFSPFRNGRITHCDGAEFLFEQFLRQMSPKIRLMKPVVCIHVPEEITQVEEQGFIEAAMAAGARKVYLYSQTLSELLRAAPTLKELRHAYVIHIEPRG